MDHQHKRFTLSVALKPRKRRIFSSGRYSGALGAADHLLTLLDSLDLAITRRQTRQTTPSGIEVRYCL